MLMMILGLGAPSASFAEMDLARSMAQAGTGMAMPSTGSGDAEYMGRNFGRFMKSFQGEMVQGANRDGGQTTATEALPAPKSSDSMDRARTLRERQVLQQRQPERLFRYDPWGARYMSPPLVGYDPWGATPGRLYGYGNDGGPPAYGYGPYGPGPYGAPPPGWGGGYPPGRGAAGYYGWDDPRRYGGYADGNRSPWSQNNPWIW
ncbi:MAG: hypothetical protein HQL53_03240 [Magnetococcales bacterium]|nr:hypothetical protein [Magnetococcales bacterium]